MAGREALLVIDGQLGMFDAPELPPVLGGGRLPGRIEGLIVEAREAGVPVIYVQHCDEPGGLLEEGSERWRVHPRVAPLEGDATVEKRTPDSFLDTSLREELASRDVGGLVLVGMATEYCVDTTCRRAFGLGYDVKLVKEAYGIWDYDDI